MNHHLLYFLTFLGLACTHALSVASPSSQVAIVTSPAVEIKYHQRLDALTSASGSLHVDDLQQLHQFLISTSIPGGMNEVQLFGLKNEILNCLHKIGTDSTETSRVLMQIAADPKQFGEIRDYALQHLRSAYQRSTLREEILNTLRSAAAETTSPLSGTALLSLRGIAEVDPSVDTDTIRSLALALATDKDANPPSRATALQVCGKMGVREILPHALKVAAESGPLQVRACAIATLGDLGGSRAQSLLEKLSRETDPIIKRAALSALERSRDPA